MAKKKMKATYHVRYTGKGYVFGVPSRDMSKAEWFGLPEERQKIALVTGTHVIKETVKPVEPEEEVNDG